MKKLLKIVGIAVLVTLLLLVGAAVALPLLVDPEDIKAQLSARVKEHTGRELSIPGEVELSVFPWLGASLGEVSLGNAEGFRAPVFASTSKVDVRVKLMPLLDRRVEMDTVVVHGLTLNLERNKQGDTNWGDLAAGGGAASAPAGGAPAPGSAPAPGGEQGSALAALSIGGLDVRDGTLSYTDAQAGQAYTVRNLTLKTGTLSLAPGQSQDLELGFDLNSANPPLDGRVTATVSVSVDQSANTAAISGLDLNGEFTGDTLPGGALSVKLGADAQMDLGKHTLAVRNLRLQVVDLVATGTLDASGLDKAPAYSGELNLAEFNPRKLIEGLGQTAPVTADPGALARASLDAKFSGSADAVSVEPLQLTLDESTVTGKAGVSNLARPAVRFALALDAIDLDRYLPPGQEASAASPGAAAGGAAGALPLDTLRALDVAGSVKAGKLEVAKLDLTDVTATINAKDGLVRLSPMAAKLYQGSYAGSITLDARKTTPTLAVDEKIAGVSIEPLLTDLQGEAARISGTAEASAKLTAAGTDPESIKKTLNGNLAFVLRDGAVKGYDIAQMIRNAKSYLGKDVAYDANSKTDFAEIKGTATVTDGVVSNPDLSAKSPLLRVDGNGQASLPAETVDYRVRATLVASSKGQGGKDVDELAGVPLPIHITGTFSDPKPRPDFEALMQGAVAAKGKELIEQQKGKVSEKVKESLGDKAGDVLKGLIK
jgi:AsmA protein